MARIKKLGSIILLIISLLFVNAAWINIDAPIITETISELASKASLVSLIGLGDDLDSLQDELSDLGVDINLNESQMKKDIRTIRDAFDDSKLSPVELKKVSTIAKVYGKKINTIIDEIDDFLGLDIAESEEYEKTEDIIDTVVACSIMYSIACTIFLILAALALLERIFGRRKIMNIVFFVVYAGSVAGLCILLSILNDAYLDTAAAVFETCSFKVTVAAIIGALLSFPIVVRTDNANQLSLAGIKSSISGAANRLGSASVAIAEKAGATVAPSSNNGSSGFSFGAAKDTWTCPSCGNRNKDEYEFCSRCGSPKPKKPVCKNCGREIEDNFVFCVYCGTRVEKEQPVIEAPAQAEPEMKFCKFCGEKILASSAFCPCCGEKLN